MAPHPYERARFSLLTQHGKERVLAPLLADAFAARLDVVSSVDTDRLGTFTREIPREGTQLDAARRKAQLAIEHGAQLGLGSEGSFVPGPFGLGMWDLELVVLVDPARKLEVVGRAYEPGHHYHGLVRSHSDLMTLAERAGFPDHALVLRPDDEHAPHITKGLRTWPDLETAFATAMRESTTGAVFVENDLRAHCHPTRMRTIEAAGRDLVTRLLALCASCGAPGYGFIRKVPGLRCSDCEMPTREPIADEYGCVTCDRREQRVRTDTLAADPGRCDVCNP